MDTSSEVTLTPRYFRKFIVKPTLRNCSLLLRQFDGSILKKKIEYFEGSLELKDKFEVIPMLVTTCKK